MKLESLLSLPTGKRSESFREDLYAALLESDTRLVATDAFKGPDGFRYVGLAPATSDLGQKALTFAEWTKVGITERAGVALFADQKFSGLPTWVFTYGSLWTLPQYGTIGLDPADEPSDGADLEDDPASSENEDQDEHEVLVGLPTEDFLPRFAREAMAAAFSEHGYKNVGVAIVVDPLMKPSRNLAFSYSHDDFPTDEALDGFVQIAQWHLPLSRAFILRPDEADWNFEPLSRTQLN